MELKEYILRKYYDGNDLFPLKVIVNAKRSGVSYFNGKYGEVIGIEKRKPGWQPFYLIKIEGFYKGREGQIYSIKRKGRVVLF